VNAIHAPGMRGVPGNGHADTLAAALGLDMAARWQPTVANYLGRVSKERILEAVREGVSKEAAENIASMKKPDMAAMAEHRLAGKGWLPAALRLPQAVADEAAPVATAA
jgi:ParB family transcriptional regulator, chromosome partitioning protein